jgi:hypothetical protein
MRREALAGVPREDFTNTTIEKMKPRRSLPEFRFVGQLPVPLLTHPARGIRHTEFWDPDCHGRSRDMGRAVPVNKSPEPNRECDLPRLEWRSRGGAHQGVAINFEQVKLQKCTPRK